MSNEESQLTTRPAQQQTLTKGPFILVRSGNKVELLYHGQSCGSVVDGDIQSLAYVIDVVTDRVVDRMRGNGKAVLAAAAVLGAVVGANTAARPKPWYQKLF